jgi:hypothetical protein
MRGRKVQGLDRISSVHGLRGRDVFYSNWCNPLHEMRDRDVLYSSRGLSKLDMQRLSVKLQLACGESRLDELRLQRGLSTSRSRSACRHFEPVSSIPRGVSRELEFIPAKVCGPEWERTCGHAAGWHCQRRKRDRKWCHPVCRLCGRDDRNPDFVGCSVNTLYIYDLQHYEVFWGGQGENADL